jgi:dephospho-CoA kinase
VLVIGLTGGIGSGKSTVATMLAERGAVVIDVDRLGREVIAPGGRAERAVIDELGTGICDEAGHIDRAALAAVVFSEPEALTRLTRISHPAINAELGQRLDALPADAVVVLDMAILVESNLGRADPAHSYSRVVSVEAPAEVRIERAVTRGMARPDVEARLAAQASDAERRAVADVVITNAGGLDELSAQVDQLWRTIQRWRCDVDP